MISPTHDEVARIRHTWETYRDGKDKTDPLAVSALVWSVPQLLARIECLEGLLKEVKVG